MGLARGQRKKKKKRLPTKNAIWALLISQLASDNDRCNPLHVNRTQNKHLPLAVCRLLRPSFLYLNEQERTFLLIEAVADLSLVKTPSKYICHSSLVCHCGFAFKRSFLYFSSSFLTILYLFIFVNIKINLRNNSTLFSLLT